MKRVLALVLILICLHSTAFAGAPLYISNPNPQDRLHLRTEPSKEAESLGKYYNGTPIERIGAFSHNGWVQVRVGAGTASLTGYMDSTYLSDDNPGSAMPQYASIKTLKGYESPSLASKATTIPGGRLISLMGLQNNWWHIQVHTGTSEGSYNRFVPAEAAELVPLNSTSTLPVYISNPDPSDRLHLRQSPSTDAKSLGKYYNGCVASLKGFTEDGEWIKVELYGRTGYLKRKFVYLEGQGANPTLYGIPTARITRVACCIYEDPGLNGPIASVRENQEVEILGLINEYVLHVRCGNTIGFLKWTDVDFVDPKA